MLFRSHDVARLVRRGLEQDAQRQRLVDVGLAYAEDDGVLAREYFGERRGHARLVLAGDVYLDDFDVVLHRVAFFLFFFSVNS